MLDSAPANVVPPPAPSSTAVAVPPRKSQTEGGKYYIVGSFDKWAHRHQMARDGQVCSFYIQLGREGRASFQLLQDRNWSKKLHPSIADANPFVEHALVGPEKEGRGLNWSIGKHAKDEATPGQHIVVLLHLQEDGRPARVDWKIASVPLSRYQPDPSFWYINPSFPGLRAVHRDPWIFLCEDVLSAQTCQALILKAERRLVPWKNRYDRTSSDVYLAYEEVPGVQSRLSDLLNMPVSHFEPLKVAKYRKYEYFKIHHDALAGASAQGFPTAGADTPFSNRVVTCFVYLQDARAGGETQFTHLGIKIKPKRGLAVIHFPGYMNTVAEPELRGAQDERTVHESLPAEDDKYICAQWGWPDPLDRRQVLRQTGAAEPQNAGPAL